jgi:hypothetical protein
LNYEDEDVPDPLLDEEDLFFYDGDDELWDESVDYEEV